MDEYIAYCAREFGIPRLVSVGRGPDGCPAVTLSHPAGFTAVVSLHGAAVTRWARPPSGAAAELGEDNELLALRSEGEAQAGGPAPAAAPPLDGVSPLPGGVTLAFPQVGPGGGAGPSSVSGGGSFPTAPADGFLRHLHWSLYATGAASAGEDGPGAPDPAPSVCLVARDTAATRAVWPHRFEAVYTVSLMLADDWVPPADEEEEEEEAAEEEGAEEEEEDGEDGEGGPEASAASSAEEGEGEGEGEEAAPAASAAAPAAPDPPGTRSPLQPSTARATAEARRTAAQAASRAASAAAARAAEAGAAAPTTARGAARAAAARAGAAGASESDLTLPFDWDPASAGPDPDGVFAGTDTAARPPRPPPPVQLRCVLQILNPAPSASPLTFTAGVIPHARLPRPMAAGLTGAVGRRALDALGGPPGTGPALVTETADRLPLGGPRPVDRVWIGDRVLGVDPPRRPLSRDRSGPPPAPGSVFLESGDGRHALELIPRAGFRDTGARAPGTAARTPLAVDAAAGDEYSATSRAAATAAAAAAAAGAGAAWAAGLVGEVARAVTLPPGALWTGEAVLRLHDREWAALPGAALRAAGVATTPTHYRPGAAVAGGDWAADRVIALDDRPPAVGAADVDPGYVDADEGGEADPDAWPEVPPLY